MMAVNLRRERQRCVHTDLFLYRHYIQYFCSDSVIYALDNLRVLPSRARLPENNRPIGWTKTQ